MRPKRADYITEAKPTGIRQSSNEDAKKANVLRLHGNGKHDTRTIAELTYGGASVQPNAESIDSITGSLTAAGKSRERFESWVRRCAGWIEEAEAGL